MTLNHPYFFALENFQIVLLSWLDQIRPPNPVTKQPAPKQSVVPLENTVESSYSSFFLLFMIRSFVCKIALTDLDMVLMTKPIVESITHQSLVLHISEISFGLKRVLRQHDSLMIMVGIDSVGRLQNATLQQLKAAVISHAEEDVWSRLINLQSYISEATTVFL